MFIKTCQDFTSKANLTESIDKLSELRSLSPQVISENFGGLDFGGVKTETAGSGMFIPNH
ncbi:hypothetical protein BGZ88_001570, partial [Linnemannia elongata]